MNLCGFQTSGDITAISAHFCALPLAFQTFPLAFSSRLSLSLSSSHSLFLAFSLSKSKENPSTHKHRAERSKKQIWIEIVFYARSIFLNGRTEENNEPQEASCHQQQFNGNPLISLSFWMTLFLCACAVSAEFVFFVSFHSLSISLFLFVARHFSSLSMPFHLKFMSIAFEQMEEKGNTKNKQMNEMNWTELNWHGNGMKAENWIETPHN